MAKMHPIEKDIADEFGVKRAAKDSDKAWRKKLHEAATERSDEAEKAWDNLTEDSQAWVNACTDAKEAGDDLPDFDVVDQPKKKGKDDKEDKKAPAKKGKDEDDEPAPRSRRAAKDEDDEPKGKKAPAKKGKDEDDEPAPRSRRAAKEEEDEKPARGKKGEKKAPAKRTGDKLTAIMDATLDNPDGDFDVIKKAVKKAGAEPSDDTVRSIRGAYIRAIKHLYAQGTPPKKCPFE